jgi:hypothetical protein
LQYLLPNASIMFFIFTATLLDTVKLLENG